MNPRRGGWLGVLLRGLIVVGLWSGLLSALAAVGLYIHHAGDIDLAVINRFKAPSRSTVTRFQASDGQLVGEWFVERRIALPFDALPKRLILCFLAAEDARFFSHHGVDPRGVARAAVTNLLRGKIAGGASTITQQLAKLAVGNERSLARKVRQTIVARRMEDVVSKEDILTLYLNSIYLGHHSYGVQAAAQNYFHKQVWELTLAEAAMLAGLPQSPSRINPIVNMAAAKRRMSYVLGQMERWGWATPQEVSVANQEDIRVHARADLLGDNTPYFTEDVRADIERRYGDETDDTAWLERGLTVTMHVEPARQAAARHALKKRLERLAKEQGWPGALGNLSRETFFRRNARWLGATPPNPGQRLLARVSKVGAKEAHLELGEGLGGTVTLATSRWMTNYTELPTTNMSARQRRRKKVSYKAGKLKRLDKRLAPGDVVLVEVQGGSPEALKLTVIPVPLMEGSIVGFDPATTGIDSAVGGWDFDRNQVHRMRSLRQTGSTMKPIIYAKLYDMGVPPSKVFSGAPFVDGSYDTGPKAKPDRMLWDALAQSENNVSLRALQHLLRHASVAEYEAWGAALGLPMPLRGNTAYVLGGDQTPLGMAHAWGVFARRGVAPNLSLVKKVVDGRGRVLERHMSPVDPHISLGDTVIAVWDSLLRPQARRIKETSAHLIAANMRHAVLKGTARKARALPQRASGKTGTLAYDVWFNGFTSRRVAIAWLGAEKRERPLGLSEARNKVSGANTALPMWLDYVRAVEGKRPDQPPPPPPEAVGIFQVDPQTGKLAREGGRNVPHVKGAEPAAPEPAPDTVEQLEDLETEF